VTASATIPSTAHAPPLPVLRRATLNDYPQIQQLESSNGLLTLATRDWRAIWLENPAYHRVGDSWPVGWVLDDHAGRLVGSICNIPSLYAFQGRTLIAAVGRAWVVAPEYRGIALWLMDEYFSNQDGVDLFINTTVNSKAFDPFSAFGSVRVPLGDWQTAAYFVTNHRGFAKAALRIKHVPATDLLATPLAGALKLKDALTVRMPPNAASSVDVAEATEFDAGFDSFWIELLRQNPDKLMGVRDSATLRWHFAGPLRAGDAWIFTARRAGLLRAYCVLKRQDHPPSGLVRMRLVDYQSLEPDDDLLVPLLHAARQRCIAEHIHVFEHVGCALPKMRSFEQAAPYRRKLTAWPYFYKAAGADVAAALREPRAWDPSSYDGDASL
jgi:hypothetical protein